MRNKLFAFFILTQIFIQAFSQVTENQVFLDLPKRGQDIYNAYNILNSLLPSSQKIFFTLHNGQTITDITSVSLLSQKTILYIKSAETYQPKYFFIPVENIVTIDYTQ